MSVENGFRYEMSIRELFYLLFRSKRCLKCGSALTKNKWAETIDGIKFNMASVPLYIRGRTIRRYYYTFSCGSCNSVFTLTELVGPK